MGFDVSLADNLLFSKIFRFFLLFGLAIYAFQQVIKFFFANFAMKASCVGYYIPIFINLYFNIKLFHFE